MIEIIEMEKNNSEFVEQYDLARHRDVIRSENEKHFSVFENPQKELIGYVILAGLTEPNDSIEFRRIVISKKGQGLGRKTLKLIKRIAFEEYNAHRLWLDVFSDNDRAIRLYETEGFSKEGLLRDCIKQGNAYRSMWIMAILSNEYE